MAPVYWQLVGTSFADALTAALLLAALWLTAEALPAQDRPGSLRMLAFGAALAGMAVAARVHNAIFAVALYSALLLVRFPDPRTYFRFVAVFAAASAGAWLVCFGPWSWLVLREFGSPVFPLFNGLFRSPDYPAVNLHLVGFVPQNAGDLLLLPFRMATYQEWRFGEKPFGGRTPGAARAKRRGLPACLDLSKSDRENRGERAIRGTQTRVALFPDRRVAVARDVGQQPLRPGAAAARRAGLRRAAAPGAAAALRAADRGRRGPAGRSWQQQTYFTQYRWASGPWAARYFDWEVPPALEREPAVYLGFGYKTASTLAPRVHPGSRHAALVAQYSIGLDHPGARRDPEDDRRGAGREASTACSTTTTRSKAIRRPSRSRPTSWSIFACGAWISPDEACMPIRLRPVAGEFRGQPPQFILCELRPAAAKEREAMLARYRQFEKTLAPLAAACPRILGGAVSIVRVHGQWQVTSFASAEYRLEFDDDGAFNLQLLRPPYSTIALGKVAGGAIALRQARLPAGPLTSVKARAEGGFLP